jgi:redox-sensing transcriptional repressor
MPAMLFTQLFIKKFKGSNMNKISDSTINRLSKYHRTLCRLRQDAVHTVSSDLIAEINDITAAQVRKDLSFFGSFGKRGTGYNTVELEEQIEKILGLSKKWNVALVGIGNIGRALVNYSEFKKRGFEIKAIFDTSSEKIGAKVNGVLINDVQQASQIIESKKIDIAIIAVPVAYAQDTVDLFIENGVRAFLNFAPVTIKTPENVLVKNENMSIELEALSYFLSR